MKKVCNYICNFHKNTYASILRHPLYNRKSNYKNMTLINQLSLMRDLRLWIVENAPHSVNKSKYVTDIAHLNSLLNRYTTHSKKI